MLPLLITGTTNAATQLNSSNFSKMNAVQMPFYGTLNALQMGYIYRNLTDESMDDKLCVIKLLGEDQLNSQNKEETIEIAKEKESTNNLDEKIKIVKEQWQKDAGAIIDFELFFRKYGVTKSEEKLSLLQEVSQRAIGAKSRCDEQIYLRDYGTVEKIGHSFLSVDRSIIIEEKNIKIYNGNSEQFGLCVAITEFNTETMPNYITEKLKNEIKIYKKLSKDSKHMLKVVESEQNGKVFKLVSEVVKYDFWELYQYGAKNINKTRNILYNEMLKALEEFHKNGMHLNINLTKFYLVEKNNGNAKSDDKNDDDNDNNEMEIGGEKLKMNTKLADFGAAILFNEKPPKINMSTDYHSVYGKGSPMFLCPEQISGAFELTPKCDVFSLGIVLYEMLAPQMGNPFDGKCRKSKSYEKCVKEQIVGQKVPIESRESEQRHLWNIVEASLSKDPNLRPSITGIRKYLRGECHLVVGKHKFGINNEVPMAKCDT
ncbi:hypothetical protein niasHS_015898 [Heterodera schachtii]|uniref:Protein kinase domain-containing protein n=1 Tax=Heterodera schachtii TaxID=97005 RepID=A0ABD2HPP1_HETSC